MYWFYGINQEGDILTLCQKCYAGLSEDDCSYHGKLPFLQFSVEDCCDPICLSCGYDNEQCDHDIL